MKIRIFAVISIVLGLVVSAVAQDVVRAQGARTMIFQSGDFAGLPIHPPTPDQVLTDVQKALKLTDTQMRSKASKRSFRRTFRLF